MKGIVLVCCLLLGKLIIAQTSSIYIQNNTKLEFGIHVVQTGTHTMSAGEWSQKDTLLTLWEPKTEILETNRNAGIHNGETFYFDAYIWHGTDTVQVQLKLRGNFLGSSLEYSLKGPGFNQAWFDNGGFHQEDLTIAGLPITIKYRPDGNDLLFQRDITYAIHDNTPLYEIDSSDYTNPNVINVLSYNVQFLPFGVTGLPNAAERGDYIPVKISPYQDVVIVQEAFDDLARNNNLNPAMTNAGFPYRSRILNDGQFPTWNGGVIIYSRWPIEFEDEYDYRNCDNNSGDCLAAKGVLYARINKLGKKYHIFGTHVEAGGNPNDIAIKKEQFGEQRDFIAAQNIPATEAVILGGDMNTDASSVQYPDLVDSLNPIIGLHKGYHASTQVDRDSGNIIDHVWGIRTHLVPVDCYTNVWVYRTIDDAMWDIFDPSDHLPVNGRFEYPDVDTPVVAQAEICNPSPFQAAVKGHPLQEYQWYLNGIVIPGATDSIYYNPTVYISDTGTYSCRMITQFTVEDNSALGHPNWPDTATQTIAYEVAKLTYNGFPTPPTVSQQGDTLFSSIGIGNQWYDANGPIPGATDSFYVMTQAGSYYVVATSGSCTSSNSNAILFTNIHDLHQTSYFNLYPNPASNYLNLEVPDVAYTIEVIDVQGRVLLQAFKTEHQTQVDLSDLGAGVYWLKLITGEGVYVRSFVLE